MIVQRTLEGHTIDLPRTECIEPGFYLVLVKDEDHAAALKLTGSQPKTIIRDVLGAGE